MLWVAWAGILQSAEGVKHGGIIIAEDSNNILRRYRYYGLAGNLTIVAGTSENYIFTDSLSSNGYNRISQIELEEKYPEVISEIESEFIILKLQRND